MDNRYYSGVIAEMQNFLDENGFKPLDDGSFEGEKGKIKVEYDDERQLYILSTALKTEEGVQEMKESSVWLFDDTQGEKDANAVGISFTEDLRKIFDVKKIAAVGREIELPSAKKGEGNVSAFAKKVLDVFPQYKDAYKEHMAVYGNFLYIEFFSNTLVEQINEVLMSNNKKQIKKVYDLLENAFITGDAETSNLIVAIVSAVALKSEESKAAVLEFLEPNKHFKDSVNAFIPHLKTNKKLNKAFMK